MPRNKGIQTLLLTRKWQILSQVLLHEIEGCLQMRKARKKHRLQVVLIGFFPISLEKE